MTDNPRELCQMATQLLIEGSLSDARLNIRAFATLIGEASRGDVDLAEDVLEAINVVSRRLLEDFGEIEVALDRTLNLCRDGTGKYGPLPEGDHPEK